MSYFRSLIRRFVPSVLCVLLTCIAPVFAMADPSSASLTVSVSDSSGAIVPGARVRLLNSETNQEQTLTSGKSGTVTFPFLKPGHYSLVITKTDFADVTVSNVVLNVGDQKQIPLVLKVGSATQEVTVDGSGLTINTTDASVSTVVDRQFVANMPLNGRSFQDLISMTPGVVTQSPQTTSQSVGRNGDFSVNGQRTESNYYTVDGISANSNTGPALGGNSPANGGSVASGSALGTTQTLLSVDALQEFRITSSTYSAEFGRTPGGQVSLISRSGTNHFHGTAFEYLRNGWFDANDWFNDNVGVPKQALRQNDFGGTAGGPLAFSPFSRPLSHTFFFASYEGLRLTQPVAAAIQYVPDQFMRDTAPSQLSPLMNAFPKQSPNGIDYGSAQSPSLAQFIQGYSVPGSIDSGSLRIDQALTPRLSAFLRFSDTPSSVQSRALSSLASTQVNSIATILGTTYTLSPTSTNDLRIGYTTGRSIYHSKLDSFGGATPISLDNGLNLQPSSGNNPELAVFISGVGISTLQTLVSENSGQQWNITDSFSFTRASHFVKLGVDYRRIHTTVVEPPNIAVAEWTAANQIKSNSASYAYIEKLHDSVSIYNQFAAFVQDDWKANTRTTVSMGLRWELNPPPHSGTEIKPYLVIGDLTNPSSLTLSKPGASLWNTARYSFAPRLGLALVLHRQPGRETVLRAGGGVFFDTDNEAGEYAFQGIGYSTQHTFSSISMPFTEAQNSFPITADPPYSIALYYPRHLQLPYTIGWSASVEQALGASQSITISYVASEGRRLIQTQELSLSHSLFSTINYVPGGVTSNYQSLQTKFQRQMSHGFSALASYTWSHALDFGSNFTSLPLTYGNADFDVRNNLQMGLSWDLPKTNKSRPTNAVLNGWGVDSRVMARTAFPVTLRGNAVIDPGTGSIYYTNVNLVQNQPLYLHSVGYPGGRILNRSAFSLPVGTDRGNAARNFVRGFGSDQLNMALRRRFPINDSIDVLFRVEAFNLLNHPNFGYIDPTLSDANFGHATQMLNQSLGTLAAQYQQGGPRSMQFALKLSF